MDEKKYFAGVYMHVFIYIQ